MPILIILMLAAACLPVAWPAPVFDLGAWEIAGWTGAFVAVSVLRSSRMAFAVDRRAPRDRDSAVSLYVQCRSRLFYWNTVGTAVLVLGGWGWAVKELASDGEGKLYPFAELLVPGPYLAILFANWFVFFFPERALHRTGRYPGTFWSLPGYVGHQARLFSMVILMPVLILCAQQSISRHLPAVAESPIFIAVCYCAGFILLLTMPLLVKPLLGLKRIPEGAIRDRLNATAGRLRFRCTDWLLWPTRGLTFNALIAGVLPRARYVIFTDRLLETLDLPELDAVVGHEIGHARHGHIPYYLAFFALSSLVGGTLYALLESMLGNHALFVDLGMLAGVLALAVYLFVAFGYLSRVSERQADLVGVRAGSCENPHCAGHTAETRLADGGRTICPTGVRSLVRALDVVMNLGGHERPTTVKQRLAAWWKSWQHGPPSHRIDFLLTLIDHPERAAQHDRYAFRLRIGILLILMVALVATATLLGWEEFWKQMV